MLKPTTSLMLSKAKEHRLKYPRKSVFPPGTKKGDAVAKFNRKAKKTRKAHATRYRSIRNDPEHGPSIARVYMRAGGPG